MVENAEEKLAEEDIVRDIRNKRLTIGSWNRGKWMLSEQRPNWNFEFRCRHFLKNSIRSSGDEATLITGL
jgi:hypothetical protein